MLTNIHTITTEINDVNHFATTLWVSGCKIRCGGCHNPDLLNFTPGLSMDVVKHELYERRKLTQWLVYLGGNPIDSIEQVLEIAEYAKSLDYYQFLYTGYTLEQTRQLLTPDQNKSLLRLIDYLKIGGYDESMRKECSSEAKDFFFASLNQAVVKSDPEICEWKPYYAFNKATQSVVGAFTF